MDIGWRLALALVAGFAVQWGIRRAVARPIRALAGRAPDGSHAEDDSGEARAEQGETEPPRRRITVALVLLRRLPLVGARLLLELLPVFGFATVGHVIAATSLGGRLRAKAGDPGRRRCDSVVRRAAGHRTDDAVAGAPAAAPGLPFQRSGRVSDAMDQPHRHRQRVSAMRPPRWDCCSASPTQRTTGSSRRSACWTTSSSASSSSSDAARFAMVECPRRRDRRGRRDPQLAGARVALDRPAAPGDALAGLGRRGAARLPICSATSAASCRGGAVAACSDRRARCIGPRAVTATGAGTALSRHRHADGACTIPRWSASPRPRSFLAAAITVLQLWGVGTFDWLAASRLGQPSVIEPAQRFRSRSCWPSPSGRPSTRRSSGTSPG